MILFLPRSFENIQIRQCVKAIVQAAFLYGIEFIEMNSKFSIDVALFI